MGDTRLVRPDPLRLVGRRVGGLRPNDGAAISEPAWRGSQPPPGEGGGVGGPLARQDPGRWRPGTAVRMRTAWEASLAPCVRISRSMKRSSISM